jgi:hypothetical protein
MWKTNGFFTRKYEDYEFDISIKNIEEFMDENKAESINNTVTDDDVSVESFRVINTASPSGSEVNDNIVFIDAIFF